MLYVAVGFLGVLVGAGVAAGTTILLLRLSADRDLVERRLRALLAYREALGTPPWEGRSEGNGRVDPAELEQALHNIEELSREFRLTAWIFDGAQRALLAKAVQALEDEARRIRARGPDPSPVALDDSWRQLELGLRQAALRSLREYRRWRVLPWRSRTNGGGEDGGGEDLLGPLLAEGPIPDGRTPER